MKNNLFLILALFFSFSIAQDNYAEWAIFVDGGHNNTNINNMVTDGEFMYINGTYSGESTSFGGVTLPHFPGLSAFLAKATQDGEILWTATMAGEGLDAFYDLKLDSENNLVLSGWSSSNEDIYINEEYVILADGPEWTNRGIVAKFSSEDGSLIWEKHWYASEYSAASPVRLALDAADNIYTGGYYSGEFQLGEVEFTYENDWGDNIFITKWSKDGELAWGQQYDGTVNGCWILFNSMDVFEDKLYLGFDYYNSYYINGETLPETNDNYYLFVGEMDTETGEMVDYMTFGTASGMQGSPIVKIDNDGNMIVSGWFTADTGFKILDTELEGHGSSDGFIAKFSPDFDLIWVKTMGSSEIDNIFNLFLNDSGEIFIGGGFSNSSDFYFDTEKIIDSRSPSSLSMFELRVNKDGDWEEVLALHAYEQGSALSNNASVVLNDGSVFSAGRLVGKTIFEEGGELIDTEDHNLGFFMKWDTSFTFLGLNEQLNNHLAVYPNPFNNFINIQLEKQEPAKVSIFNMIGQQVFNQKLNNTNQLDLSHLPKGVYVLKVDTDSTSKSIRLIKK